MISAALTTYGLLFAPAASQAVGFSITVDDPSPATYGTTYVLDYSGDALATFSAGSSDGCEVSGTQLVVIDVEGSCDVLVTDSEDAEFGPYAITLLPKPITVTVDAGQTKVYGDPDPAQFAYTPDVALEPGDSFDGALSRDAGEDVALYAIGIGTLTLGPNYDITFVGDDFEITPLAITVNPVYDSKSYDGTTDSTEEPEVDVSTPLAFSDLIDCTQEFDDAAPSAARTLDVVVDSCTITADEADVTANYTISYGSGVTGEISLLAITVDPVTDTKPYDGSIDSAAEPVLAAGFSLADGDVLDCTQEFSAASAGIRTLSVVAGSCTVMNGGTEVTDNYDFDYGTPVSGEIELRTVTVDPVTDTKAYDATTDSSVEPVLAAGSTLADGDDIDCTQVFDSATAGARTLEVVVDSCVVMNGTTDVTSNYDIDYGTPVAGEITKAAMPLTGPGAIVQPGALSVTLTATIDPLCRVGVTAEDIHWTVVDLFGGLAPSLIPVGGYASGVATMVVPVVAGHIYGVTVSVEESTNCDLAVDPSGTISIPDTNAASQGGGWYRNADGKANVGYTVSTKYNKRTEATTISGNLLWVLNAGEDGFYRIKGTITGYGAAPCTAISIDFPKCGVLTGTATVQKWDPEALEGLGDWVTQGTASFEADVFDGGTSRVCTTNGKGKTTCKDTTKPDAFLLDSLVQLTGEGTFPTLTVTSPTLLRGGNLTVK